MKNGVEIAKMKKEIENIVGSDKIKETTQVIGFAANDENEEYEEEEEE